MVPAPAVRRRDSKRCGSAIESEAEGAPWPILKRIVPSFSSPIGRCTATSTTSREIWCCRRTVPKEDFQKALDGLRQEILNLQNLESSRKEELTHDIESVERESRRDTPEKGIVVSRLNSVKATLEAVKGTVIGAADLGKAVAQTALWAAAFLR